MDSTAGRRKTFFAVLLLFSLAVLLPAAILHAERSILTDFSFDDCDPFEARAIVMDIVPGKGQLIAAEQTIYVVDMLLGDRRLITEITDADGRHLDFGSFSRGQWIHVKGFRHINGGVIASWVQKIDPPEEEKPVLRRLVKQKPLH
jgi:hypothetical protein